MIREIYGEPLRRHAFGVYNVLNGVCDANTVRRLIKVGDFTPCHLERFRAAGYETNMDVPSELLRAARVALNIGQRELAKLSGVGQRTILRIERNDETVSLDSRRRLQEAFEKAGVTFVTDDGESGPGLRIRKELVRQGNLRF